MKNKLTTILANLLRRPVLWAMDALIESWRKNLPKFQERRWKSDGSIRSHFWAAASKHGRQMVNEWDRMQAFSQDRSLSRKLEAQRVRLQAKVDSARADLERKRESTRHGLET